MATSPGVLDKPILISPRSLGAMVVGIVGAYALVLSTFVTQSDWDEHTSNFQYHVDASTIWQLETRAEDISDQSWLLKQRMEQPGGNTPDNRLRARELEKREKGIKTKIECLRNKGDHCLGKVDRV